MSDLLKLLVVGVYIFLVYKYYKNTVLLLLFTLATILILCNINKVTEGYSGGSMWVEQYATPEFKSVNSYDKVDIYDKSKGVNSNRNSNRNVNKNSNSVSYSDIVVPVSPFNYQMGPFDQLVLTTGNPKSEYLKLKNAPLSTKEDICVYQGHENPLKCEKTTGLNIGPSIDGTPGSPNSMFMFANNKSSPACCPSTFSTSTGCVCTTQAQRDYVAKRRGLISAPQPVQSAVSNYDGSPFGDQASPL